MKFNRLDAWPHVHLCLIDRECLKAFWEFGAPLRLHYKKRLWEIPGLIQLANWRWRHVWDWEHPIKKEFVTSSKP